MTNLRSTTLGSSPKQFRDSLLLLSGYPGDSPPLENQGICPRVVGDTSIAFLVKLLATSLQVVKMGRTSATSILPTSIDARANCSRKAHPKSRSQSWIQATGRGKRQRTISTHFVRTIVLEDKYTLVECFLGCACMLCPV